VRRLPGQLLHNIISHGIARIAEYISGDSLTILAHGFTSPRLRRMGERRLMDELRVTLCDSGGVTAYFTFSTQMRPALHQFRIYGPRNGLLLDQDNETLIQLRGDRFKSYAEHFLSPLVLARQYAGSTWRNVRRFLANDFQPKSGLKYLIDAFYGAIANGTVVPIPYREIVLTAHIMDEIFRQIAPESHHEFPADSEQRAFSVGRI
jgi:predicted dehydrogenase